MNTEDNKPEKIDNFKNAAELLVELVSNEVIRKLNTRKIPQGDLIYKNSELVWGDLKTKIERNTVMDFVCDYLFKRGKNNPVSWDEVYESWAGSDSKGTEWRKMYDACKALNQRAIDTFGVPIFEWQNKEITLKY